MDGIEAEKDQQCRLRKCVYQLQLEYLCAADCDSELVARRISAPRWKGPLSEAGKRSVIDCTLI
jgi:hypothetical protein